MTNNYSNETKGVFKEYAGVYDLFYVEKNYEAECKYIEDLIAKYSSGTVISILDIGCGTGGHALILTNSGFEIIGMDLSEEMLVQAREKAKQIDINIEFTQGDVKNFDIGRRFDAVTAMFAVISYLTNTQDILSSFAAVRKHLKSGGLFLFDAWFGPGVLSDPPREKITKYYMENTEILRTVIPEHDMGNHLVKVNYDILCIEDSKIIKRIKETHSMRYFFPQEVSDYAKRSGFDLISYEPFMKPDSTPQTKDWNMMFVLKAI